jgi:hypothetical protein
MALQSFKDAAGREAWLDPATNMVYTEGGNNPTYYTKDAWNQRQIKKYGASTATSTGDPAKDAVASLEEITKKLAKEETKFTTDYLKNHPFAFDEELAKMSATQEYEPYYSEILNDYISDIGTQRSTVQDEQALTQKMKEYEVGVKDRAYTRAISQTEEGFVGNGLYFSGQKDQALGNQEVENQASTGNLMDQYGAKEKGFQNQLGLLDTSQERKTRDVGREQKASIESGITQRKTEQEKSYYNTVLSSYYRQFPTSTGGGLKGYVPDEYLRY